MQVWRGPRPAYLEPATRRAKNARPHHAFGSRHLSIALLASTPVLVVALWLWIEEPGVLIRFATRLVASALLLVFFTGLGLRAVRRRGVDELRALGRVIRRLESGDFDGQLPEFAEPEAARLATVCTDIGRRMREAEEQLIELRDRTRRERMRQESVVESIESENARLRAETTILHGFGGILNRTLAPSQICSELITNIRGKVEFATAIVYLLDDVGETLVPQAVMSPEHHTPLAGNFLQHTPAGQEVSIRNVAGWVTQTGKVVRIDDAAGDSRCADVPEEMRSILAVPLRARQGILGVIQLEHRHRGAYDGSDERILASLANQAAIAVENVHLFEEAAKVTALRELDRLKSELLSTVSHELRTPLASIKGYAGTLLRSDVEWDDETRREFLQIIDEESDRLSELIEDLLQMSQIEAGTLRIDPQPLRIPRMAQRVVKRARSSSERHSFTLLFPPDFPEVQADSRRIEQVLRNLVENAVKYSPDGGTVTVRGDVQGDKAVISVSDEGIGISPEDLARVFDRFYRADGAAVQRAGGTGLGLSICQGIVQVHGGHIWAESQPSAGSTFRFTLPLVDPNHLPTESRDNQEEPV